MTALRGFVLIFLAFGLMACGSSSKRPAEYAGYTGPDCTDGPRSKYGNPNSYKVLGKWYHVLPTACGYEGKGIASWYGPDFHGKRTSSGETYDMYGMTAAHKTLPIPARVKVTNLDNGKSIVVRVNDRGPFHEGRIIDLSKAAAQALDVIRHGTARVKVETIGEREPVLSNTGIIKDYRDSIYVQVGSFTERFNAEKMLSRLLGDGFSNVQIQSVDVPGGKVNRVRVGPLASSDDARDTSARLERMGYRGHRVLTD